MLVHFLEWPAENSRENGHIQVCFSSVRQRLGSWDWLRFHQLRACVCVCARACLRVCVRARVPACVCARACVCVCFVVVVVLFFKRKPVEASMKVFKAQSRSLLFKRMHSDEFSFVTDSTHTHSRYTLTTVLPELVLTVTRCSGAMRHAMKSFISCDEKL